MPETKPRNARRARFSKQAQLRAPAPAVEMHGNRAICRAIPALSGFNSAIPSEIDQIPGLEILSGISNSLPAFSAQDTAKRKTIRISPLGEFPITIGGRTYIQAVDETAVNMMVRNYTLPIEQLRQLFSNLRESWHPSTGLNIYEGHIDDPGYVQTYQVNNQDNRSLASIKRLHINQDTGELMADVAVNQFGIELMAGEAPAYGFHSPHWKLVAAPDLGPNHVRPAMLLSSALTNTPNIPDNQVSFNSRNLPDSDPPSKESENQPEPENSMNPELLKKLGLAEDATPEQIEAAVNKLLTVSDTADAAANSITTLTTERDAATAATKEARTALIGNAINSAITTARITEADRPAWQTKLDAAADLQTVCNTIAELEQLKPVLHTAANSQTENLPKGNGIGNTSARKEDLINGAVNSIMTTHHVDRPTAFRIAQEDPKHKDLFN